MRFLATVALAALVAGCTTQAGESSSASAANFPALAGVDRCASVTPAMLGAASASSKWVAEANGAPGYCEVTATLSPVSGSNIGVVYRLPGSWNGKVLGLGGGGWAGNVSPQAASEGLRKGYATLQTDAGHAATTVWDTAWAANPEALKDFSYRAVHEMTVVGKKLVDAYYGQAHRRAYFQGCSTGGRMALMEAQRYPADYDAISAGAPVYTLQVQTSSILRNNAFAKNGGGFSAEDLKLAQNAALDACDAQDGLKDGLINDPRQCHWDPAAIQCSGAKNATCLAPAQVAALRAVYAGTKAPDGEWAMLPMNRGGEADWTRFVGTNGTGTDASSDAVGNLFSIALGGRKVDFPNYSMADVQAIRASDFGKMYEAADPNLRPFFSRGGKLLLWHGQSDPGPSPVGTSDYAQAVLARAPAASQNMRFFLLPGVEHCGGGPGAAPVEWLDALADWDEGGKAPEVLVGAKPDKSVVRPHCAWPDVARYKGSGEANDPAGWQCVRRSES
jgi:feruloyl esterase